MPERTQKKNKKNVLWHKTDTRQMIEHNNSYSQIHEKKLMKKSWKQRQQLKLGWGIQVGLVYVEMNFMSMFTAYQWQTRPRAHRIMFTSVKCIEERKNQQQSDRIVECVRSCACISFFFSARCYWIEKPHKQHNLWPKIWLSTKRKL